MIDDPPRCSRPDKHLGVRLCDGDWHHPIPSMLPSVPPTYCKPAETRPRRDAIAWAIARIHSHRKPLGILVRSIVGHVP